MAEVKYFSIDSRFGMTHKSARIDVVRGGVQIGRAMTQFLGSWLDGRHGDSVTRQVATSVIVLFSMLMMLPNGASAATSTDMWSPPVLIGAKGSSATQVDYSISCPTSTFCVSVNGDGQVLYYRSGVWSLPRSLALGGSINSVSCSSTTFCVAVAQGKASVYNGHKWSSAVHFGPTADTYKVSCPRPTFCAAVGANGIPGGPSALVTFNGHTWTPYKTTSTGMVDDRLLSVSCPTPRFCMATNFDGQILSFDGVTWTPSHSSAPKFLISVSCTSSKYCMTVTTAGQSMTFQSGTWRTPKSIPAFKSAFAYAVSCASETECSVIGLSGAVTTWSFGRWSTPFTVFPGGTVAGVGISCSTKTFCVAVNDMGMATSR
jgi:hypothetical protein